MDGSVKEGKTTRLLTARPLVFMLTGFQIHSYTLASNGEEKP